MEGFWKGGARIKANHCFPQFCLVFHLCLFPERWSMLFWTPVHHISRREECKFSDSWKAWFVHISCLKQKVWLTLLWHRLSVLEEKTQTPPLSPWKGIFEKAANHGFICHHCFLTRVALHSPVWPETHKSVGWDSRCWDYWYMPLRWNSFWFTFLLWCGWILGCSKTIFHN